MISCGGRYAAAETDYCNMVLLVAVVASMCLFCVCVCAVDCLFRCAGERDFEQIIRKPYRYKGAVLEVTSAASLSRCSCAGDGLTHVGPEHSGD